MRTDQLIQALAADLEPQPKVEWRVLSAVAFGALAALGAVLVALGPRSDLPQAIGHASVALKHLWPLLLALAAAGAVFRSARPGATLAPWRGALLIAPALVLLGVSAELVHLPPGAWRAAFLGDSVRTCLTTIPLLSLPILVASLIALRHGASLRPALTGAMAGMMSGGLAAALYALHCIEDSPLFYATWYSLGISMVTMAGAIAGSRLLRW